MESLAPAPANCGATAHDKWNVRTQLFSQLAALSRIETHILQSLQPQKGRGRVRTSSAEARPHGNALDQLE